MNDTDCIIVFNIVHIITKSGPVILEIYIICFRQKYGLMRKDTEHTKGHPLYSMLLALLVHALDETL